MNATNHQHQAVCKQTPSLTMKDFLKICMSLNRNKREFINGFFNYLQKYANNF